MEKILVWDLPVRIGHWLLAAAFAVAWLTGESENWRAVHVAAGALMCAVVVFRLLWGFIGSRHARFADFAAGPLAAFAYLGDLLRRRAAHFTGHNPAGAWAIYLLLSLSLAAAASGWCVYSGLGGEAAEELHELTANALLLLVGLHIVGVVVGGLLHDENLVRAMLTGRKLGRREDAITRSHLPAALVLLVWAAAVAWLSRYI
ncbi:cytochrome B [Rhodocyclus tenuis]|nr:cytochrome B [Rhodocyclus tenuis]